VLRSGATTTHKLWEGSKQTLDPDPRHVDELASHQCLAIFGGNCSREDHLEVEAFVRKRKKLQGTGASTNENRDTPGKVGSKTDNAFPPLPSQNIFEAIHQWLGVSLIGDQSFEETSQFNASHHIIQLFC